MGNLINYKCYDFPDGGFASFVCNSDGSSTVTPYSDNACTTQSGPSYMVSETVCAPAGSMLFMKSVCRSPHTLTGYYDYKYCSSPDTVFKYPLGTCQNRTDYYMIYSASKNSSLYQLEYSTHAMGDCSDEATTQGVQLISNSTCSSSEMTEASISSPVLAPLESGQRYVMYYADSTCSTSPFSVTLTKDGCIPVPGVPSYGLLWAALHCNPDGTSLIQLFDRRDTYCASMNLGDQVTVLPSDCSEVTPGFYLKTTCQPPSTPSPTSAPHSKRPTAKPTRTPHFRPTLKPT